MQIGFFYLWLFIAAVSVHDGYLVALHRDVIGSTEQNPLGRYLIELNGGQIWVFLGAKAVGTVIGCGLMLMLHHLRPRLGLAVARPVAVLQLALLLYLTLR